MVMYNSWKKRAYIGIDGLSLTDLDSVHCTVVENDIFWQQAYHSSDPFNLFNKRQQELHRLKWTGVWKEKVRRLHEDIQ